MQLGVIDIGGTSIKYGVVTDQGNFLYSASTPTEAHLGGMEVIGKVLKVCDELRGNDELTGIAISSAGQIDNVNGTVVFATNNIPGYTGVPVAELVRKHTGLPVTVENDVNCTALGEYWKGAAVNVNDFLCVTIGTGIGGALFLNGELYTGSNFSAGEIGHISLYPNGKPCTCGNNGCFEKYASSAALEERIFETLGQQIDLKEFFTMTKQGNHACIEIFEKWIDDMTTGLQSLVHIFNPKLIVIGGGVSAQGEFLLQAIKRSLMGKVMPNHRRSLEVKLAENDNKANLLGAAKHYLMNF
ncbi:ROK family protein [Virgibacillus necropolis]|uniref:N-acetylmannosamine kinase n=1 Tax=Virgibacillus necropolis TaxID=163877 RepID=A0A221MES0_9BACI|nr:ROK family protein [Virgibacillus necropolis]ASN06147.1 N-acetylmannosamine kinase [Virgibacillus necropolis]